MKAAKPIIFACMIGSLLLGGCKSKQRAILETPDAYPLPREIGITKDKHKDKGGKTKGGEMVHPELAGDIIKEARRWLGTKYKYGGSSRKGTDCSGMVWTIYRQVVGIELPRNSLKQFEHCLPLERHQLTPGDLVFFNTAGNGTRVGHVGIYIGDNSFIHASTSRGVIISTFDEPYYTRTYNRGGRVPGIKTQKRR